MLKKICKMCDVEKKINCFDKYSKTCKRCVILKNTTKVCYVCKNRQIFDQFNRLKGKPLCNHCAAFKICKRCEAEKNIDQFKKYTSNCNDCMRIIEKEYRLKNKDSIKKNNKMYAESVKGIMTTNLRLDKNKDKIAEYKKNHRRQKMSDPEYRTQRNIKRRAYRKEKKLIDPQFKMYDILRKRIAYSVDNKSNSSKKLLGCDMRFYTMWLEYTMTSNMNWSNHGSVWHVDHVNPISNFDMLKEEDQLKAFNWTNTQALDKIENITKNNKVDNNLIENHKKTVLQFKKIIEFKQNLKWTIRSQFALKKVTGSTTR